MYIEIIIYFKCFQNFDQDLVVLSKGEWFLDKPFNWDLIRFNKRFNLSGVKIIGTAIVSLMKIKIQRLYIYIYIK